MVTDVLRRLSRHRHDDDGVALLTVVGTMAVVTTMLLAVLAYVIADVRPARADQDAKTAMAAAQAGVDDYLARLTANDTYWTVGNTDSTNPALTPGLTSAAAVPGTGGTAGSFSYRVLNSVADVASTGTIQLQVRGTSRAPSGRTVSRTLVASLETNGFLKYLYFTDVEAIDPELWRASATATASPNGFLRSGDVVYADPRAADALCSRQYWAGRTTSSYRAGSTSGWTATIKDSSGNTVGQIPGYTNPSNGQTAADNQVTISGFCDKPALGFFSTDTVAGPMHTNDVPRVVGSVTFSGTTTVYWPGSDTGAATNVPVPHTPGDPYYRQSGGTPQGHMPVYGGMRAMPSGNDQLLRYVLPKVDADPNTDRPGCLYSGATKIVFNSAGTMSVTSPNSASTDPTWRARCLPSGPGVTNTVPVPRVVYVQRASGPCTGVGYPATGEVTTGVTTDYSPCNGTAFVSGRVHAQVTVGTQDDVVVTGDLTYASASGTDVLGLIANNDVWVYHPVDASGNNLITDPARQVHNISAAILSLQHSFLVQNYRLGAPLSTPGDPSSYLNVTGSIAQKFRGPVVVSVNNTPSHGYAKNYVYDTRFRALQPPYFIKPLNTPWALAQLSDG